MNNQSVANLKMANKKKGMTLIGQSLFEKNNNGF